MRRLAALVLLGVVALTGCASGEPERPCVSGHHETYFMPISTGKTTTLIPVTDYVCDEYGPKPEATDETP